jgi:hypothetical protein
VTVRTCRSCQAPAHPGYSDRTGARRCAGDSRRYSSRWNEGENAQRHSARWREAVRTRRDAGRGRILQNAAGPCAPPTGHRRMRWNARKIQAGGEGQTGEKTPDAARGELRRRKRRAGRGGQARRRPPGAKQRMPQRSWPHTVLLTIGPSESRGRAQSCVFESSRRRSAATGFARRLLHPVEGAPGPDRTSPCGI